MGVQKILKHFEKVDPTLYRHMCKHGVAQLHPAQDLLHDLCRSIVGQQLSVKAAASIFSRFEQLFPNSLVTPMGILALSHDRIRSCGMSNVKAKSLIDIALRLTEGRLDLEQLQKESDEDATRKLMAIYGVGEWTAQMFLMFALARPDIFSYKDAGLMRAMKNLYNLDTTSPREDFETIISRWSPYKTYACRTLWSTLDNKPL